MMMMMRAYLHIAIITINAVIVVISAYLNDSAGHSGDSQCARWRREGARAVCRAEID